MTVAACAFGFRVQAALRRPTHTGLLSRCPRRVGSLLRRPRRVGSLLRLPRRVGAGCGASLGRSGAGRADCLAVLGLAAASPNSLRSLRSLRSDSGDESVDERAARWPQALRSSAPQRRAAPGPHTPWATSFWRGGGAWWACGGWSRAGLACAPTRLAIDGRNCAPCAEGWGNAHCMRSVAAGGARWGRLRRRAEERRGWVGARSALRALTHRHCLRAAPAGRAASLAMRPATEHRRSVGAFSARPRRREPPPGTACCDAGHRQGSPGPSHRQGSPAKPRRQRTAPKSRGQSQSQSQKHKDPPP